jgi:hypothetical protein
VKGCEIDASLSLQLVLSQGGYGGGFANDAKTGTDAVDAIEEVKKEIRGVKGVLLSAKRFAPVGNVP